MKFSIELMPMTLLRNGFAARVLPLLPSGTRVFLPSLPIDPPDAIELALSSLSLHNPYAVPVPHIAATRCGSVGDVTQQLSRWHKAVGGDGIREVLVVRGDAHGHSGAENTLDLDGSTSAQGTRSWSDFDCSLDLLASGALQRGGIEVIGVCGHPEGISELSTTEALAALTTKLTYISSAGLRPRVVTQFCYDYTRTTKFIDELREHGFDTEVSLGVVGPSSATTRARMARRCGVAAGVCTADIKTYAHATPVSTSDPSNTVKAVEWPWDYMRAIACWQEARGPVHGVQALHMYPFGGAVETLGWMHDVSMDTRFAPFLGLKQWVQMPQG